MSKLLTGRDRGWRGGSSVSLTGKGTPADLLINADMRVDDFRRYDIMGGGGNMRLISHCTGHYTVAEEKLAQVDCSGPVGGGQVALHGTIQRLSDPFYDMSVAGSNVSLGSVMGFVRHAKRDLPEDLSAAGTMDFAFTARKGVDPGAKTLWSGGGTANNLVLHSQALGPDLPVGTLTYAIAPEVIEKPKRTMRRAKIATATPSQEFNEFRVSVAPFPLALGGASATVTQVMVSAGGFSIGVAGDADVARALQVSRALGIDTPKVAAKGAAKLDIHIAGHWTGFEAPEMTGGAQLKNVQADIPGVIETLQLNSAAASFDAKSLSFQNVVASFATGPNFTGTVAIPRNCVAAPCPMTFAVHADELSPERLNQLLNPKLRKGPWYNFFMPQPAGQGNPLLTVEASGELNIDRWNMEGTVATHVNAAVKVAAEHVTVSDLHADLLGGQHTGDWEADFTGDKPLFAGKGKLVHANMALLAAAMQDAWATGNGDMSYQLKMSGATPAELAASVSGLGEFSLKDGALRHLNLDVKAGALKVTRFDGTVELRGGSFVINDAKLQSGATVYTVQGSATWARQLDFKLTDNQRVFALSGTLAQPEVKPAPATEAALKP
jgi:hypothetical protein